MIIPHNQTYTFAMQYQYDSYNRIQRMTYPDGEVVSYGYNRGGMLESVLGNKNGVSSDYIKEIRYNKYELKDSVSYGNGTSVRYLYDSLLRLSHLRSECADGVMQDIDYDYDEVSNINSIENLAGVLPNNLGGTYRSDYTYDNLYRLISANGEWHGNNDLYYETSMDYEANGRISRKVLYADTWLNGNYTTESYTNDYHYNSSQPNTLAYIDNSNYQDFAWDRKGNMVFHHNDHSGYDRRMCWDEQNRLQGVVDYGQQLSYYQYDAGGERTYKFTGEYAAQNQSGQWHYFYRLDKSTLYASPYIVSNEKGYTKHYYAESERIASRIGGGGLQELDKGMGNEPDKFDNHKERANHLLERTADCLEVSVQPMWDVLSYLYEWREIREEETDCYWYHPDHLGSSSWITYSDGSAVQHLHYLPWGEDFVDQRSTSWNAMYTFSAKEKDTETGYSYFGSRYYSSDLSIWLSVDPMSDKYPSLSPYTYCADNPVKLVDPNGEEIGDYYSFNGTYLGSDGKNDNKLYRQSENGDVIYGFGVLKKPTFEYVGDVDETALKYEGTMYEKKDGDPNFTGSISVGKLAIVQKVGEEEFVKERYDVLSGGWGNGSIQNGDYLVNNLRDNRTGSYENHGIGFTFDVNPRFKTCRTLLRIHPDGGIKGTEGCIGLTGGKDTLLRFKNSLNNLLKSQGSVNLNVSISKNPNRSGC